MKTLTKTPFLDGLNLEPVQGAPLSLADITRRHNASLKPDADNPRHLSLRWRNDYDAAKFGYGIATIIIIFIGGISTVPFWMHHNALILVPVGIFSLGLLALTLLGLTHLDVRVMKNFHDRDVDWLERAVPETIRQLLGNRLYKYECLLSYSPGGNVFSTELEQDFRLGLDLSDKFPRLFVYSNDPQDSYNMEKSMVYGFISLELDDAYGVNKKGQKSS